MSPNVHRAIVYATCAHEGQERKWATGVPYIVHPLAVLKIVTDIGGDEAMQCAAVLHDVVEDTGRTIADIQKEFGDEVAVLVDWLTDVSTLEDGNRRSRKAIDRAHSAEAPRKAQTIKVADLIDNTESIVESSPEFAKIYMEEKRALLDVLLLADHRLIRIAKSQIDDYYKKN